MSPSLTNSDRIRKHTPKGAPKFDWQNPEILQVEHVHTPGLLHAQSDGHERAQSQSEHHVRRITHLL